MTNRRRRYRCLICTERFPATRGPRAVAITETIIRRPGKHSNHRHPGRVSFEPVKP